MGAARKSKEIRQFMLDAIPGHPRDVIAQTVNRFGLTRQAISIHMNTLVKEGLVKAEGKTRQRIYKLAIVKRETISVPIKGLEEDRVWREHASGLVGDLPTNVYGIWHYGFTEMVNNVIDHSGGTMLTVTVGKTAATVNMIIKDDGIGIFRKITTDLGLEDERHAILELSKGKLTTDPVRHSGEGIFFASRMFDHFQILSGGVYFSHEVEEEEDWIPERGIPKEGTAVIMSIGNSSPRTTREIFDKYSSRGEDYGFTRTVVPVRLAGHGLEQLISRSQAKRLVARFDRFRVVILDFKGVDVIGQAFADEVFRVFPTTHPHVRLIPVNANRDVKRAIRRAKSDSSILPLFKGTSD